MLKIQVSTSSTGTQDATHFTYTFGINPTDVDLQDSKDLSQMETLHGSPVFQLGTWDGRIRKLIWQGPFGASSGYSPNLKPFVDSARSWCGSIRYINFQDLNILNASCPTSNTFKKCRVIDIQTKIKPGLGLRYESVILEIVPEI